MTTVYLIRHVQAQGNLRRVFHGHTEGDVTDLGRRQAERLRDRFASVPLTAIYASDLYRARFTAETIASAHPGVPLVTTPALREIHAGAWEGNPLADIAVRFPDEYEGFLATDLSTRLGGGESLSEAAERLKAALFHIAETYPDGTVAVVSHGCALKSLFTLLCGEPVKLGTNATVSRLEVGDAITVCSLWDDSHLIGVQSPAFSDIRKDV